MLVRSSIHGTAAAAKSRYLSQLQKRYVTNPLGSRVEDPVCQSISCRLAVAPRIARGDIPFDSRIAQSPDELAGTEILIAVLNDFNLMAQGAQLMRGRARHRRL